MMKRRYHGEMVTRGGHTIRVEIWKDNAKHDEELVFPADEPVCIEWADTDKINPVASSSCTLKIESVTDRQFLEELYTVEAGSVVLKVYRDNALYWSGTLDPEQYEEPYSMLRDYDVTVTFQDFAVLERMKYIRTDGVQIKALVEDIISRAGIAYNGITWKSATKDGGESNAVETSYVKSANWYDEEGEAMTLREVLDAVLQAFSLRVKQKAGRIYVYDLHTLYAENPQAIDWNDTDSYLGVDAVYNDIEVTFSPYENKTTLQTGIKCIGTEKTYTFPLTDKVNDVKGEGWIAEAIYRLPGHNTESLSDGWWNYMISKGGESVNIMDNREGFRVQLSSQGKGAEISNNSRFFRIVPLYTGQEEEGVAVCISRFDLYSDDDHLFWGANSQAGAARRLMGFVSPIGAPGNDAVKFARFYVPALNGNVPYSLRLKVEALIDTRIDPYDEQNYRDHYRVDTCDHIYVPYNLKLEGDDGNVYYWDNSNILNAGVNSANTSARGTWKAETARSRILGSNYSAVLHYMKNMQEPSESDAKLGWNTNKFMMAKTAEYVSEAVRKVADGEMITLPNVGGWVTLSISDIVDSYGAPGSFEHELNSILGWFLIKSANIDIVDKYGRTVDAKDIVSKAVLNADAKEKLEIDTYIDCSKILMNNASGLLVDANGAPKTEFIRNGERGTLAELMCNTIYSQYAKRKIILSGTAELISDACILSDRATDGKFILLSEVQRLRENESVVKMVQFNADEYCPVKTEEG